MRKSICYYQRILSGKEIPDIALRVAKLEADFTVATMPLSSSSTTEVAQAKDPKKKSFKDRF